MYILIMARIIAKTGVGNHVKQLSEELANQGHKVWVVASTNEMDIGKNNRERVLFEQVELRSKSPITIVKSLNKIHRIIIDNQIEIVHCHHRMAGLFMKWYNLRWSIPYVWTLHLAPIPCDPIHRMMTSYGKCAIAVSYEVGEFLKDRLKVPEKDIRYVLNGVDEKSLCPLNHGEKVQLRKQMGIPVDKVVVALHSRVDPVKNHEAVVEAVGMLAPYEREKLMVLCSGEKSGAYYEMLQKRICELGICSCFHLCGWVNAETIIGASDALMLPSLKEGFGLNCIEAMFMRVPVFRTKTCGYRDMQDYCVGMEDAAARTVLEHLRGILSGETLDENRTKRAEAFVRKNCTVKAMTEHTAAVYEDVLKDIV